jgi:hypothetical protein
MPKTGFGRKAAASLLTLQVNPFTLLTRHGGDACWPIEEGRKSVSVRQPG